jgi:hypothetical protein
MPVRAQGLKQATHLGLVPLADKSRGWVSYSRKPDSESRRETRCLGSTVPARRVLYSPSHCSVTASFLIICISAPSGEPSLCYWRFHVECQSVVSYIFFVMVKDVPKRCSISMGDNQHAVWCINLYNQTDTLASDRKSSYFTSPYTGIPTIERCTTTCMSRFWRHLV